jgi:hypothetical protein
VFSGGIVGAAFGTLWAVILCALIILVGIGVVMAGGSDFLLMQVGLGPIFGPHVGGFASGIAAASYAAGLRKNHPGGAAKDILSPLLDSSWDVLVIGGIFALLGHALLPLVANISILNKADAGAVVVVVSNMVSRLLFCQEWPWGNMKSIQKFGYLKTDNYAISWAPWQAIPSRHIVLGFGVGVFSGAISLGLKTALVPLVATGTVAPVTAFIIPYIVGWALAIVGLIPLNLGTGSIQKVPIAHAIALCGSLTLMHTGNLLFAGIAGLLAALIQELMARMFYNHGSSHIDPPATAILVGTLILNCLF